MVTLDKKFVIMTWGMMTNAWQPTGWPDFSNIQDAINFGAARIKSSKWCVAEHVKRELAAGEVREDFRQVSDTYNGRGSN